MMAPKKEDLETLGLRLNRDAIIKLKKLALDLDTTASDITKEALILWWSQEKEAKQYGALFPEPEPPKKKPAEEKAGASTNPKTPPKRGAKAKKSQSS